MSGRLVLSHRRPIPGPPTDAVKARLLRLFRALERRFGPQHWWPGRTPFEIALGAVLTQHTAWTGAARAIAGLRAAKLLDPHRLDAVGDAPLAAVVRPAGTHRLKARKLKAFTRFLLHRFDGRFAAMRVVPLRGLREELLGVPGLGPETVDAILLYAAGRPVFVADAYARRVLARHGLVPERAGYEEVRAFVERHLPSDPALFNELHALLVAAGKAHCRTVPRCDDCPLGFDLSPRASVGNRSMRSRALTAGLRAPRAPRSATRGARPRRARRARAPAPPSP
jgi:endonuclease III related protein